MFPRNLNLGQKVSIKGKILVVSGIYPPDIGGPATYIPLLCRHLVSQGFEVSLVSLQEEIDFKRESEPWKRTFIFRNSTKIKRIISTMRVLYKESGGCQAVFANGLFEEVGILKILRPNLRFVAKIVGDPVWERNRNKSSNPMGIEDFNRSKLSSGNLLQRLILVWALNRFNYISCPSLQLKDLVSGWGVRPVVSVIHNGIKCREITTEPKQYDVVSVSRLVPWKNLDVLISSCARVNLSLAICGEGPEMQKLKEIAREKSADVEFLGMIDALKVSDVMNRSNIFSLISSYEGLSFALLEAMMAGKRIVVSNCKGNTDVITNEHNGLVVDIKNEKELDDALIKLSENLSAAAKMSVNAHNDVKAKYCAEKQLNLMSDMIIGRHEK
jgi:glycosyltransferase involved in cell wall biosynthesis